MTGLEDRCFFVLLGKVIGQSMHQAGEKGGPHIRIFFGNRIHNGNGIIYLMAPGEIQFFQILLIHEAIVYDFGKAVCHQTVGNAENHVLVFGHGVVMGMFL